MTNDLLNFARWVDNFEQCNRDRKFASIEEALETYRAIEGGAPNEVTKFISSIPPGTNGITSANAGDELSLELIERAMKEEGGEYFYLVYTPGPNGAHLMDMSARNGKRLIEVLVSYALQNNAVDKVMEFSRIVSRVLNVANLYILKETARRAKNN